MEQAAGQQTGKKKFGFCQIRFWIWNLQALARGENVDEFISLTLPPAADRDGEEEEEGGDDGEDDGDDHGAEASPPEADQLGAHLAEGADVHLVVRGQLGLVWLAWEVTDDIVCLESHRWNKRVGDCSPLRLFELVTAETARL